MAGVAYHWEVIVPPEPHSRCAGEAERVRAQHKASGYADTAYTVLACNHDDLFLGRGWNRQSAATCNSYWNARFPFSVCWMGGPGHAPTQGALNAMRRFTEEAKRRGANEAIGHLEACATQCPGPDVMAAKPQLWLPPAPTPTPTEEESPMLLQAQGQSTIYEVDLGGWAYPSPGMVSALAAAGKRVNVLPGLAVVAIFIATGNWDFASKGPKASRQVQLPQQ